MTFCFAEGSFRQPEEVRMPVSDLALQRGVGVFETIRTYNGRPMALSAHLKRLAGSAAMSRISLPMPISEMEQIIRDGLSRRGEDGRARPVITGGDVLDPQKGFTSPRFFVFFEPLDTPPAEAYEKGVALLPVDQERPLPRIKSINYMPALTSMGEDPGALEVLYCPDGLVTEAARSSAFMVSDGGLVTAPVDRVLAGTRRSIVIELAREAGLKVDERCPRVEELNTAMEFFITGSVKEVMPVTRIGRTTIGSGMPGPLTRRLHHLFLSNLERWME